MRIYFELKEFLIEPVETLSREIADKIYNYHIIPMIHIRHKLGFSVYPSKRSSYRSRSWELAHGRKGGSQHCFIDKGATDWTCTDFSSNKGLLLSQLMKHTKYTRIAVYKTFIHCDYKATVNNQRQLFDTKTTDGKTIWAFKKFIE